MADDITPVKKQSKDEIRIWDTDFTDDLKSSVTVSSATATHVPPDGGITTSPTCSVSGAIVSTTFGTLSVTGTHYLKVLATLSDGEKSSVRYKIDVPY